MADAIGCGTPERIGELRAVRLGVGRERVGFGKDVVVNALLNIKRTEGNERGGGKG